jgi:GT2 family glycosyltransferase
MTPEISIVIPCLNARAVLEACLASIYGRPPRRPFEVIVVNDGSTDGTPDMVRERFPQARLVNNATNLGYSAANNRGVEAAAGRYVHLLNSDVEFTDGSALDLLADHLDAHPEVGAAGNLLYNADGSVQASAKALPSVMSALFGARSPIGRLWPNNRLTRRELLHWKAGDGVPFPVGYISSASLMIRRELFRGIGGLDTDLFHFSDADLCKRIWDAGQSVVCVPAAKAVHDAHQGGTTASFRKRIRIVTNFHRWAYRYYRKHSGTSPVHPARLLAAMGLTARWMFAIVAQLALEALSVFRRHGSAPFHVAQPLTFVNEARPDVDVSVIIASYNARAMTQACLQSLNVYQGKKKVEILVIDDASSDGTAAMVRGQFPQVDFTVNPQNIGYGRSCNLLIARATGRYIYLLNNDVELLPGVIDELVDFLDARSDAIAAGSLLFNGDGSIQRSVKAHPSFRSAVFGARSFVSRWFPANPFTRAELLHWRASEGIPFTAGYVSGASLMVRREAFTRIGALDPVFTYFNDADFCRRLWQTGAKVYYVPQAREIHYDHQGGTLVNPRRRFLSVLEFHIGVFRYYRRHSGRPAWHPLNAIVLLGLLARFVPCIVIQMARELTVAPRPGQRAA